MQEPNQVLEQLKLTAEIYGKQMSIPAATMFAADLKCFTPQQITEALAKCRKELRTFPTVADIASRISDGRPGEQEAWGLVPKSEEASAVLTDEILEALGAARSLLPGDEVAARMAFLEVYRKRVSENRAKGVFPKWVPSLGTDKSGRAAALDEAVRKGRITTGRALVMLPELAFTEEGKRLLTDFPAPLEASGTRALLDDRRLGQPESSGARKKLNLGQTGAPPPNQFTSPTPRGMSPVGDVAKQILPKKEE